MERRFRAERGTASELDAIEYIAANLLHVEPGPSAESLINETLRAMTQESIDAVRGTLSQFIATTRLDQLFSGRLSDISELLVSPRGLPRAVVVKHGEVLRLVVAFPEGYELSGVVYTPTEGTANVYKRGGDAAVELLASNDFFGAFPALRLIHRSAVVLSIDAVVASEAADSPADEACPASSREGNNDAAADAEWDRVDDADVVRRVDAELQAAAAAAAATAARVAEAEAALEEERRRRRKVDEEAAWESNRQAQATERNNFFEHQGVRRQQLEHDESQRRAALRDEASRERLLCTRREHDLRYNEALALAARLDADEVMLKLLQDAQRKVAALTAQRDTARARRDKALASCTVLREKSEALQRDVDEANRKLLEVKGS